MIKRVHIAGRADRNGFQRCVRCDVELWDSIAAPPGTLLVVDGSLYGDGPYSIVVTSREAIDDFGICASRLAC